MVDFQQTVRSVIGLDIGEARTGVAIVRSVARIPSPLTVITDQDSLPDIIANLIQEHDAIAVVVGLPRNLQGDRTSQTAYVESVVENLKQAVNIPIHFIDEAATSIKAEAELKARQKPYDKSDIDMLSATYILDDYLATNPEIFTHVQ